MLQFSRKQVSPNRWPWPLPTRPGYLRVVLWLVAYVVALDVAGDCLNAWLPVLRDSSSVASSEVYASIRESVAANLGCLPALLVCLCLLSVSWMRRRKPAPLAVILGALSLAKVTYASGLLVLAPGVLTGIASPIRWATAGEYVSSNVSTWTIALPLVFAFIGWIVLERRSQITDA
jgi:hypothetical protein